MLDSNRLEGKVALITGAGGAIGAATARLMAARGARIIGVDRDQSSLDALKDDLGDALLATVVADVTDEAAVRGYVEAAKAAAGRIDVFFNNAGIEGPAHPLPDFPLADFQRVIAVNVTGVFLGMKYVIPVMLAGGGGAIINTSSTAGLRGTGGLCAYIASKHAVIGLTRTAADEWAAHGIRVNCVNPGPIESRMMRSIEQGLQPGDNGAVHDAISAANPARRYGLPEEVATMVAFLASDDARYVHGAIHAVDGGRTAV
ncbi:SDR family NAD(P)-dependent oxidoreductase [Novosphingobium lentum]|uniref:SDR family NAD(P)-dependent oxidoreductase n=1 Tax=Novosphingobium lentum TaxID=145287 RepID=UPI00082CC96C|nr:SDR family NAD(P)-dependent oxidoreductase [Novosphingobium lentum]